METFVQFLEELADSKKTISISASEVSRLVDRFGDRVRLMGRWNASTDGSLDVLVSAIREAATELGNDTLTRAVEELKADHFARMLEGSSAISLIEKVAEAYRRQFRELMTAYQNAGEPEETIRLRDQLVSEVFGE
jgi:hypothetical protein